MCCKQLCIELAKDYPDYWREQVDNTMKLNARLTNLASVRDRLLKDNEDGFGDFLNWFDKWFLTRATPTEVADA